MLVEITRINKEEKIVVSSRDVAEQFEKEHSDILKSIHGYNRTEKDGTAKHVNGILDDFDSSVNTLEYFIPSEYKDASGKTNKEYLLTRDGFSLLAMGFTGEKALKFKIAYIKQFNAMENLLKGKLIEREKGIAVRQSLTKALQQSKEDERMHGHAYSTYTNCIYKVVFGMNAKQLREFYKIDKRDNLRDYFSEEELKAVQSMECLVSGLVDCGWDYDKVKSFIEQTNTKQLAG